VGAPSADVPRPEESPLQPIPLSVPWLDDAETGRVGRALAGRLAGNGPFCTTVERRLSEMLGGVRVLLTTSCTHALELALLALGVGPGDEVVCPSFTFVSTANAILRVGARPVFADVEEDTLGLDPRDVVRRVTERTAALLPVHYAGVAADMDGLMEIARGASLRVVEDAAQGLGATFGGRALGAIGDAGCFSFHETKNVTCGEGGALAVRDPEVAARAEVMREKGTNRAQFLRGEVDKYTWVSEGSSYVLSDVLAALLDAQLDKFDEIHRRRARVAARYREELASWADAHGVRFPFQAANRTGNDHLFFLLTRDEASRDACMEHLRAAGVMATFHYIPLHSSPYGRELGWGDTELPATDRAARTLVRLPLHPLLADQDVDRVIAAVRSSLG
jgi:dTDP-4-amino-4,6-dideoxygalactose transaminase